MLPKHPREANSSFPIPSPNNPTMFLLPSAIIFFLLLTHCSSPTYADDDDPLYQIFGEVNSGNYTCNSTYNSNLNLLIPSLSSTAFVSNGFSKATFGVAPDQVFGLVLCRGDINATLCRSCLDAASVGLVQLCPLYKRAITWYNHCLLRYSNSDFLSSANNSPELTRWDINNQRFAGWDPNSESNKNFFTSVISTLLSNITDWALNNSTNRFAIGKMDISDKFPTLYGLVQCTPDLSDGQCHECLQDLTNQMIMNFDGRQGGRILGARCNLRYQVDRFFFGEPAMKISLSAATTPSGGKSKLWIIITVPSLALLFLFSLLGFLLMKRKRRAREEKEKQDQRETPWKKEESSSEFSLYSFSQIANATNHFSHENKLGEGGFGPVYKGQLPEGLEIAAKRLSARSGQGQLEFKNEIQLIAKLQHRNLVSLIGCCTEGEEKILIYEYMPNKSLDIFLFDQIRGALLDWSKRFHIIEGIAQGLLYLHKHSRLRIIHRDLKASNILLDRDMNPKISDFGMARISGSNEIQTNTNRVVGTYGYMSPECAFKGLFSIKSDIFSFGVLLLEIVSGKRNSTFQEYDNYLNLLSYAWELWKEGKWIELIDASLGERYSKAEIERSINVALMCVQENAVDRPTISNVIAMLSSEDTNLPNPKQPAFFNLRIAVEVEDTLDSEGINV